jgi:hypothetical protein
MKRIHAKVARLALAEIAGIYVSLLAFGTTVAAAGPDPRPLRLYAPRINGPASTTDIVVAVLVAVVVVAIGVVLLVWADRAETRERRAQAVPVRILPPGRAAGQGTQQTRKAA